MLRARDGNRAAPSCQWQGLALIDGYAAISRRRASQKIRGRHLRPTPDGMPLAIAAQCRAPGSGCAVAPHRERRHGAASRRPSPRTCRSAVPRYLRPEIGCRLPRPSKERGNADGRGEPGTRPYRATPPCQSLREQCAAPWTDRKSTRLNSSHSQISYAVFCLKKKNNTNNTGIASSAHSLPRDVHIVYQRNVMETCRLRVLLNTIRRLAIATPLCCRSYSCTRQ